MIVAMQTGTDFPSYPHSKIGSRGWFFAGNDLSSLFAIMFPIIVLYSIHKTTSFSKIYYWIPTILAMYASIMVGTKVGYGAIVITLGVALFFSFIEYMINRKKERKGFTHIVNTVVAAVILGGLIVLTPHTPIAKIWAFTCKYMNTKNQYKKKKIEKKEK